VNIFQIETNRLISATDVQGKVHNLFNFKEEPLNDM